MLASIITTAIATRLVLITALLSAGENAPAIKAGARSQSGFKLGPHRSARGENVEKAILLYIVGPNASLVVLPVPGLVHLRQRFVD
jgi:hypothetical protein